MRGDLGQTSAADLCRGLADAGSTGAVTIAHSTGEAGIYFRRGVVYFAESPAPRARLGDRLVNAAMLTQEQLVSALRMQAESSEHVKLGALLVERELVTRDVIRVFVQEQILDALFEITSWREGSYEFIPSTAAEDRLPVELSVDQMLVEVARRQSEWDQIKARIPSLDMVPDFVTGGSSASAALEPDEFAVLASVDGRRSIRDLADDLGYSEFEAARIVYGLALLGIVDVRADDEGADEDDALVTEARVDEDGPDEVSEAVEPADDVGEHAPDGESEVEVDDALAALDDLADEHDPVDEHDVADADYLADEHDVTDADLADLELDLEELAVDDEDDDVDVASALEEALYGTEDDLPDDDGVADVAGPPRVKIHDGPDGFQWDALDGPVEDQSIPPPPPPVVDDERDTADDDVAAALTDALSADDDPSVDEASLDDDPSVDGASLDDGDLAEVATAGATDDTDEASDADDEPEPFVLSPDELETPDDAPVASDAGGFDFFATPDEPGTPDLDELPPPAGPADEPAAESGAGEQRVSGADLDDSDFDRLLDELAGTGDSEGSASGPYTSAPSTPAPAEPAASGDMPSPPRSGGDVSEFLRELSRLAVDDPGAATAESDDDEDDAKGSAAQQAASAAADAKRPAAPPPPSDDDKKKRGFFGRKR